MHDVTAKLCAAPTISHQFILACHLFPFGRHKMPLFLFSSYVSSFNAMSLFVFCDFMHIAYKMSDVGTIHLLFATMRLQQWNLHDLMQAKLEANEMNNYSLIYCFAFNLRVEVNMEVAKLVIMLANVWRKWDLGHTRIWDDYFCDDKFMIIVYFDNVIKCGVSFFSHHACCCCPWSLLPTKAWCLWHFGFISNSEIHCYVKDATL